MAFPDGTADFRSDTVTQPTAQMRAAMAEAVVGDDAYGEDPTVNRLEEESAAAVGKASALFVPSGTMANQLALWALTDRGDDVLCSGRAHIRNAETGAGAALSGVGFRPSGDRFGLITSSDVESALVEAGTFLPPLGLVAFENTHYFSGGTVLPPQSVAQAARVARENGVAVYVDGARLWNAVAASGVDGAVHAEPADAVSFCFSKGLGAPVGSVLCASTEL
ncbi:MAG: threonine aldolase family protein, partial [Acidimicrobiia bacterium]|nr:threonine aldolase family protein [Acidimicrobiia bacterium]